MTLRVLVFAEDVLGVTLARDLYDRAIIERGPRWMADLWSDPAIRKSQRVWSGIDPADDLTKWTSAKAIAAQHRVVAHGLGLQGYSLVAYRAARLAARIEPRPDVVVLCMDTQGRETPLDDLARQGAKTGLPDYLADVARVAGW